MTAANLESGTISYTYDNSGNLTGKTDARSIVTSYAYDALNRVTQRSYYTAHATSTLIGGGSMKDAQKLRKML
ncbi:MAG TPA: RHS repeat domain-containing protein [Pyrinomonadaceae bacterium]|nr:RHS repeat domain-containing protein [Pyrinomonadaceae bacterium]